MTIGERIKDRRKQLGLSAEDVAKILNVDRSTVYRYESSFIEKMPTTVLEPLAKALQTTPAYLMGWSGDSELHKKEDAITDIFKRLKDNPTFLTAVQKLYVLSDKQLEGVIAMLSTFEQD